jgi:hypothetical protein
MKKVFGLVVAGAMLAGCAMAAAPLNGSWFTDLQWSMQVPNGAAGSKAGEAKATSILGLICTGDCSVQAAAKAGGITKVTTVEHHSKSILGLFAEFTTQVTGE